MKKIMTAVLLMSATMFGQSASTAIWSDSAIAKVDESRKPAKQFSTATAVANGTLTVSAGGAKQCAFGFTPQLLLGEGKTKPPTPREEFEDSGRTITTGFAIVRYHQSCPYERAIELFGEDRVTFEEVTVAGVTVDDPTKPYNPETSRCQDGSLAKKTHCVYKEKRVLVDGEEVYREAATLVLAEKQKESK